MKTQLMLCLFLILFSSNNRIYKRSAIPESGPSVISLIERHWQVGADLYVKLTEYTRILHFNTRALPHLGKNILEAYLDCRPMRFFPREDRLIAAVFAGKHESDAYLSTLDHIRVLELKDLNTPASITCPSPAFRVWNQMFARFLKDSFGSGRQLATLSWGCESRAGIIAKFLGQALHLRHYKMFLEGHIIYRHGHAIHNWSSHVVNLLPLSRGKDVRLLVFDPFTLDRMMDLEDYLRLLSKNGSRLIEYSITEPDVFILYRQHGLGVMDRNYYFSGTIFRSLFI
jgi:hypothetical protein